MINQNYFDLKKYLQIFFFILLIFIIAIKNISASDFSEINNNVKNYNQKIEIFSAENFAKDKKIKARFHILVAEKKEQRNYGLMNVKNLDEKYGMLFLFSKKDIIYMWMKNTFIALDMIFIEDDEIVAIHENAKPLSLDIISSQKKVNRVLEVNSGMVKKYDIKIGDKIIIN